MGARALLLGAMPTHALFAVRPGRVVTRVVDTLVIGAGFAGLGAALHLAEHGGSVALCETLNYPGGCAGTFEKGGHAFEAGATLFSGFHDEGLFSRWIERHRLPVRFELLDPIVELRTGDGHLLVSPDRATTVDRFCAQPGAPVAALRAFFALQQRVADTLWPIFDDAGRLPPLWWSGLGWHLGRSWRYPALLGLMNRSLGSVLASFGLDAYAPLVRYCDAVCQITIQTTAHDAEALFALSAMDYLFRGTGHIRGGIGELAKAMVGAIERCGGEVTLTNRVRRLEHTPEGWRVQTRRGVYLARNVLANLLPQAIAALVPDRPAPAVVAAQSRALQGAWGAAMLYLVVRDHLQLPAAPHHYQCVADDAARLQEGAHLFCSLAGRDEPGKARDGLRTATVSTHLPLAVLRGLPDDSARAAYVQGVQDRMRATLRQRLPEIAGAIEVEFPGSPRTFERFTGRPGGSVGGIPRTRGWHNYRGLWPTTLYPRLWMIGDTTFPGQSTLAAALGGVRVARRLVSGSSR